MQLRKLNQMVILMKNSVKHYHIYEVVLIAICTTILTTIEFMLSFLPNIQLTFLLIVVYSKTLKTKRTLIIIFLHVLLDNLICGTFNLIFVPTMLIGYSIIPLFLNTICKHITNIHVLAVGGVVLALLYSWLFIIPNVLILNIEFKTYLIADLPFEGLLACSTFLSILWLYEPLTKVVNHFIPYNDKENNKC